MTRNFITCRVKLPNTNTLGSNMTSMLIKIIRDFNYETLPVALYIFNAEKSGHIFFRYIASCISNQDFYFC